MLEAFYRSLLLKNTQVIISMSKLDDRCQLKAWGGRPLRCLFRFLVLASTATACALNIPNSAANPPVDMFGGILNQMIQQDMQQRARREE